MEHNDLTIVSIYGHNNGASVIPSIRRSMKELPGSRGLLLSIAKPDNLPNNIEWKQIGFVNYLQYSVFMMHQLYAFIDTEYCLIVQDDGWVLDGDNFMPEYYEYDYIGAPSHCAFLPQAEGLHLYLNFTWVGTPGVLVVQNGGFSLRSKRFLSACNKHGITHLQANDIHGWNEDAQLSALLKPRLQELGYRYAPDHIAKYFSLEYTGPGFHEEGFAFDRLLGCHAQSRKLMDDDHIIVPTDITNAYGEIEFLDYLQSTGYTVEYKYAVPVQV